MCTGGSVCDAHGYPRSSPTTPTSIPQPRPSYAHICNERYSTDNSTGSAFACFAPLIHALVNLLVRHCGHGGLPSRETSTYSREPISINAYRDPLSDYILYAPERIMIFARIIDGERGSPRRQYRDSIWLLKHDIWRFNGSGTGRIRWVVGIWYGRPTALSEDIKEEVLHWF